MSELSNRERILVFPTKPSSEISWESALVQLKSWEQGKEDINSLAFLARLGAEGSITEQGKHLS